MRYRVKVPIGKKEPGPGHPVGAIIEDGDLAAKTIEDFVEWGLLSPIAEKKTAVNKTDKKEVKDNA